MPNNTTYDIPCVSLNFRTLPDTPWTALFPWAGKKPPQLPSSNLPILSNSRQTFTYFLLFQALSLPLSPCDTWLIKSRDALAIYVTVSWQVFINSLAKVEMLWGRLEVVSGSLYVLLPCNICMAKQSTLWAAGKQWVILLKLSVPIVAFCEQYYVTAAEHTPLLYFFCCKLQFIKCLDKAMAGWKKWII